jgi:hypothetical protein
VRARRGHDQATPRESIRRREFRVARDSFATWWTTFLADRRPYVSSGTLENYETHGRKRLLPFFGELRRDAIDEPLVREWLIGLAAREQTTAGRSDDLRDARTPAKLCTPFLDRVDGLPAPQRNAVRVAVGLCGGHDSGAVADGQTPGDAERRYALGRPSVALARAAR